MLCFVVCNRSEWGTVFYFQFAIFQWWTAVLKREKKNSWINPVPLASFNTGAVEDVCDVLLDSWWRSQWRLDWWTWCVLIWNKIFGEFIYVPVSVKRFLFVGGPDRLPRLSYLQWKKSGRKSSSFSDKSWGCCLVFLLLSAYSCIQSIGATAFLCTCIYNLNTLSRTR